MIEMKKEAKIMQRGVLNRYSCSDGTGSGAKVILNFDVFLLENKFCRIPASVSLSVILSLLFLKVHWLSLSSVCCAPVSPCAAALVYHSFALFTSFVTPSPFS